MRSGVLRIARFWLLSPAQECGDCVRVAALEIPYSFKMRLFEIFYDRSLNNDARSLVEQLRVVAIQLDTKGYEGQGDRREKWHRDGGGYNTGFDCTVTRKCAQFDPFALALQYCSSDSSRPSIRSAISSCST